MNQGIELLISQPPNKANEHFLKILSDELETGCTKTQTTKITQLSRAAKGHCRCSDPASLAENQQVMP